MNKKIGEMAWLDLSVENAEEIKDFYQEVIGWQSEPVSMGDYSDYTMISSEAKSPVGGVCHAKGENADLPPSWLPYFLVANIDESVTLVIEKGGKLVSQIKTVGDDKFAVIKDPAGAVCAIYQKS
ncbi:VOC family protein [Colwelliaceae bacterium 6441]